jgi:hypothetical protein
MPTDKASIVVLETKEIEHLTGGRPLLTPDGKVLVLWTPDPDWLAGRLRLCETDGKSVVKEIVASQKRPQAPLRPPHDTEEFPVGDFR